MKIKTYRFAAALAVLLALCLVFMAPVGAEVVLPAGVTTESFGDKTVTDGTNYYTTLKDALAGIHLTENRTLWCKPGADVGVMTHGHVCDNLTVYGNGARLTASGEQDFEVDTYKFCHVDTAPCNGLTKDLTLTVYNLNGCGAWGQRTTGNTVTLNFYGCEDMNRVYISGTSGVNNIALTDCTFLGSVDNRCTLYSNANGEINLTNVQFSNIYAPVNLNHKVAGTQEITISNCTFTNCSTAEYDYAAPIRVLSSVAGASSVLTVEDCTITDTNTNMVGQNVDILLDYGVGITTASISGTAAKVIVELENNVGEPVAVIADEAKIFTTAAVIIGDTGYATLADAVAAVGAGETITLLKDVELSAGITTSHANGFTLDGNGYSIMPANENNLGYQAVYFFGGADATYTLKNITFKDFVQTNVDGPILRLESVEQFNLIDVTFDNCELDLVGGEISEHSIMRVYDMNFEADNLVIKNCKGAMMMDIGPSSDNYIGKIVIKNSAFINNTALGTALIYPTLTQADNSYLSVSATTFKDNVIGDANADAPAGRGVIHLGSDAYIDGCTFDNNTVYGSHVSNVNYGINEYSGHELEYTNNVFRNSAAYQTNENIGPVSGLAMMGVGTLKVEGNTVEDSNKFYHRTSAEAEYTEQPVRSVGSYSIGYGLTTITSGTYYGALSTYAGDNSIVVYGGTFSSNPSAYIASGYEVVQPGDKYLVQKYVDRSSSSSSSSSTTEPEEPEQPEEPVVEPETPVEEPEAGEVTVETEVTDGGEVEFEAPVEEPEAGEGETPSAEDEAKITGVVLPTGTEGKVEFIPVSEQPAPAGQEENTKKVFEINVPTYEKGKPATIKFTMTVAELEADGKTAADVALWHFDEETGEWTKLVTSYTIVDGVVYFEAITNDFSPFAIIYEDEPVDEPVEEPETPASPAPVLGLLAALGAAVVLRRK